ncbi:MAG: ABC transporter ATP-binding protein [bacterium]
MGREIKSIPKRLLSFLTPYWHLILIATIASAIGSSLEASIPVVIGMVIDTLSGKENMLSNIINNFFSTDIKLISINILPIYILTVILITGAFSFIMIYTLSLVGQRAILRIRESLFSRLIRLSLSFHSRIKKGDFISRLLTDVSTIQDTASSLKDIIHSIVMVIIILIIMFSRYWELTLLTIITFPLLVVVINRLAERMRGAGRTLQKKIGEISAYLNEALTGIRLIKAFTREEYEDKRFLIVNVGVFRAWMRSVKLEAMLRPLMEFCSGLGMVIVFWVGCKKVMAGAITTGMLMEFIGLVMLMYQPIRTLGRVSTTMQRTFAASERIFEVVDSKEEIVEQRSPVQIEKIDGYIAFKNVYFSYDNNRYVLKDINLKVEPNEAIALVGPSGAGKTTLVNLIPRFYDTTQGNIYIDDIDIKEMSLRWLRSQIGIVPQEMTLFGMTVKENILYGRLTASMNEVIESAKLANAHHFIEKLPQKYDTQIGEGGKLLSGGEQQRLAIARAILSDTKILILDEATSSVDAESEALIQEALLRLIKNRTTFIIAHRLSTVRNVNRIVVLNEGRIVEIGDHRTLIRKGGLYARLCKAQLIS